VATAQLKKKIDDNIRAKTRAEIIAEMLADMAKYGDSIVTDDPDLAEFKIDLIDVDFGPFPDVEPGAYTRQIELLGFARADMPPFDDLKAWADVVKNNVRLPIAGMVQIAPHMKAAGRAPELSYLTGRIGEEISRRIGEAPMRCAKDADEARIAFIKRNLKTIITFIDGDVYQRCLDAALGGDGHAGIEAGFTDYVHNRNIEAFRRLTKLLKRCDQAEKIAALYIAAPGEGEDGKHTAKQVRAYLAGLIQHIETPAYQRAYRLRLVRERRRKSKEPLDAEAKKKAQSKERRLRGYVQKARKEISDKIGRDLTMADFDKLLFMASRDYERIAGIG
jgi:hypothetical protein